MGSAGIMERILFWSQTDLASDKSWLLHMTLSKSNGRSEALLMKGFGRPPGGSAYQTPGEHLVREPVPFFFF